VFDGAEWWEWSYSWEIWSKFRGVSQESGIFCDGKMGVKEWVVIRKEHNSGENMGEIVGG